MFRCHPNNGLRFLAFTLLIMVMVRVLGHGHERYTLNKEQLKSIRAKVI